MSAPAASHKRPTLGRMVNQSTLLLMVVIGILIFVLAFVNLVHKNANATKGYVLRTLENERSELLREQQYITAKIAEARALKTLEHDPTVISMGKVSKPQYVPGEAILAEDQPVNDIR